MLIDIGAEKPTGQRDIPKDRNFVLNFLHILPHETPQRDGLPIVNGNLGLHFAG